MGYSGAGCPIRDIESPVERNRTGVLACIILGTMQANGMFEELPTIPDYFSDKAEDSLKAMSALVRSATFYRSAFFATIEGGRPIDFAHEKQGYFDLADTVINA
jgi:hypothetical protein